MYRINTNPTTCRCIFKALLTDQDFRNEIVFHPHYFVGYEKRLVVTQDTDPSNYLSNTLLYQLYKPMCRLIDEEMCDYSLQTIYRAYFTIVRPEFSNYYGNSQALSPDVQSGISLLKDMLNSLYNSTETEFASANIESVKKNAYEMVRQEAMITVQGKCSEFASYNFEDVSLDDLTKVYTQTSDACTTLIESVSNDSGEYDDFFDPRLLVKIDSRIYPTGIEPLNFMLSGGFNSQTLTGFFTTTGGGKSTLLFTLMCDALKRGQNVYFVNLEMNDYEVNANLLSGLTGRPRAEILENLTDSGYMGDLEKEIESLHLGSHNIFSNRKKIISQAPVNFNTLRTAIHQKEKSISRRTGVDFRYNLIIVDYLYLMDTISRTDNMQLYQQRKQLMVEAHDFAQSEEYAVISVFQANRQAAAKMTAGVEITSEDIGDSYSALSDIDNMFVCQRKFDEETGKSGIMVTDVKIRQMYEGEKRHFFIPYNFKLHVYDSFDAKYISPSVYDVDYKSKSPKKFEIDLSDVLDLNPELKDVCGGVISNTCVNINRGDDIHVAKYSSQYIHEEFEKRGWKVKTKKDYPENVDFNDMAKVVVDAINKTIDAKKGKLQPAKDVKIGDDEVKITGNGLFDIDYGR